jgi:hypothetical protein
VKLDIPPQIENVSLRIDHLPMLGQLRSELPALVGAQQGIVNQTADARGIGVCGKARVEIERLALNADVEISAIIRPLIGGRKKPAAGIERHNQQRNES